MEKKPPSTAASPVPAKAASPDSVTQCHSRLVYVDYGNSTLFGQQLVKENSCDPILANSMWGNGFLVVKGRGRFLST